MHNDDAIDDREALCDLFDRVYRVMQSGKAPARNQGAITREAVMEAVLSAIDKAEWDALDSWRQSRGER